MLLLVAVLGGQILFGFLRTYLLTYTGERIIADIRLRLCKNLLELSASFFSHPACRGTDVARSLGCFDAGLRPGRGAWGAGTAGIGVDRQHRHHRGHQPAADAGDAVGGSGGGSRGADGVWEIICAVSRARSG